MDTTTCMRVYRKTLDRILTHGEMGDTYDEVVNKLLDKVEKRKR